MIMICGQEIKRAMNNSIQVLVLLTYDPNCLCKAIVQ